MAWVETESLSFTARHDDADTGCAQRILDSLEDLRLRLEERFDEAPGDVTVVIHDNPAWLSAAHPLLPAVRWSAAPAGAPLPRRAGRWTARSTSSATSGWSAAPAARTRCRPCSARPSACTRQLVLAANNDAPAADVDARGAFLTYLRWAWLVEGAVAVLLRPGLALPPRGDHPPARGRQAARSRPTRRDAILLGGTVFDLLDRHAGPEACALLASRLPQGGPDAQPRARLRGDDPRDRAGLAPPPRRHPLPGRRHARRRPASGHRRAALAAGEPEPAPALRKRVAPRARGRPSRPGARRRGRGQPRPTSTRSSRTRSPASPGSGAAPACAPRPARSCPPPPTSTSARRRSSASRAQAAATASMDEPARSRSRPRCARSTERSRSGGPDPGH